MVLQTAAKGQRLLGQGMCVIVACVDAVFPRLSQLLPLMSDLEYLQDQHLLLSVKSCDGFESYGQSDKLH